MVFNRQQIEIVTTFVDNVSGATKKVQKSIQDMGNGVERTTTQINGLNAKGESLNSTTTQLTTGMQRFNMSLLSVMFFGMAMNRMFNALIKTSLEWVGITELMTQTLGIFFLPVAEQLLEILLPIMMWFIDLPDGIKKVVGWFVVFGAVMSAALFLFGQFGLGLIGLQAMGFGTTIKNLLGIGTAAKTSSGKVKALSGKLSKIAKYAGATILFGLALKDAAEEQFTAAIGDVMMGIGLLKGGRAGMWLGVIGFGLKLFGDKEFLSDVISIGLKTLDFFVRIGEEIGKAIIAGLTPGKKYKVPSDIGEAVLRGVAKANVQSGFLKTTGFSIPEVTKGGGLGSPVTQENINNQFTYNITGVSSPDDVKRMLEENNKRLTDEIRRSVKT